MMAILYFVRIAIVSSEISVAGIVEELLST